MHVTPLLSAPTLRGATSASAGKDTLEMELIVKV